jgi:DNA-binding FadR family transcriptional regulator
LERAVRDQDLVPYAEFAGEDEKLVQRMAADRCAGALADCVSETDMMKRYGVGRGTLARAIRLRQTHAALLEEGLEKLNSIQFFELNAEFHEFVAACSHNRFLEQAVINQNRIRRFFSYIAVFATERMRVSCSEHVAILDR